MRKATPVLSFASTVYDAIHFFRTQNTNFAAVQASPDRFHGVVTEGSLMRIYLRHKTQPQKEALILYRDLFEPAQLIHEDEPFAEIIKKLVMAVGNRIFVINNKTEIVGFITVRDILPHLSVEKNEGSLSTQSQENIGSDLYLYENFFTQSPFMMHSVNRAGNIRMANLILHRALGFEFGELVGKPVFEIYPKEVSQKVQESLAQILDEGFYKVVKGQMVQKTGSILEVEMFSRALTDQAGQVIGTITVSRPLDMAYLLNCLPPL